MSTKTCVTGNNLDIHKALVVAEVSEYKPTHGPTDSCVCFPTVAVVKHQAYTVYTHGRGRNSGSPVVRGLPETWSDYQR